MNTKALARLYDRLTPDERLPLITAAMERGDEVEAERLSNSAPIILLRMPDYYGLGDGWTTLTLFHMIETLDLAVRFWWNLGMSAQSKSSPVDDEDVAHANRLFDMARYAGYRLCVEVDAWKLVCSEGHYNPDGTLRFLTGFETVKQAEENARMCLWTQAEAAAYLKKIGREDMEVPSVERSARNMREFIDHRVKWWNE